MALLRKNRILSPTTSPNRDITPTAGRTPSTTTATSRPNVYANTNTITNNNSNKFHPRLIFSQMLALQSLHYIILSILMQINYLLYGNHVTIDRIFTAKHLSLWSHEGRIDAIAIVTSSLFGAVLLAVIVEKSKKCLDFAVTLFMLHFILCALYDGTAVLHSLDFWIVHVFGMIIMVLFGEFLCSRRELMDIPLL